MQIFNNKLNIVMIIKTVWRNLWRHKTFSLINILGLTVGVVSAALIFLWIDYSYDTNKAFSDAENIYVVKNNQRYGDDVMTFSSTSGPMGPALSQEIPGFKEVARTLQLGGVFGVGEKFISGSGIYADSSFFDIFSFPVVSRSTDFSPASTTDIAISSRMATTFFNDEIAIGKTISFNKKDLFTVKMIYDFPGDNITVKPDFVVSMNKAFQDTMFAKSWSHWGQCGMVTYASLKENVSTDKINQLLKPFVKEKSGQQVNHEVFLYPVLKLAVYNSFKNGIEQPTEGTIKYIRLFGWIAVIILVIACINFMNLSTARSERRAKEIGLKKVVGATRNQIIGQFLLESIFISFVAIVLAVSLLYIVTPAFGRMLGIELRFNVFDGFHAGGLILIGLFCGLLAGSYPSLYLSSFNPITAIKKQFIRYRTDSATILRKVLVVVQFSVAVVLIVAVFVIYGQINHARNRDLGYDLTNVISLSISDQLVGKLDILRQELTSKNVAEEVSISTSSILGVYSNGGGFSWKGKDDAQNPLISFVGTNAHFLPTMDLSLAAGRNFSDNVEAEANNVIINDALAKLMGAEGKVGGILRRGDEVQNIIGITQPFVFNDLYGPEQPLMFFTMPASQVSAWGGKIFIKLSPGDISSKINSVEAVTKTLDASLPFNYMFLNEQYDAMFKGTRFIGDLALLFGALAIFISCMGLFGLSAFMAEQRIREVGIRKVMGASVSGITTLLSKEFLKLVGIAIIIAIPIAWYYMNGWLQAYEYRIALDWWIFLLAGLFAIVIALVTVSFQAIRAAIANPIKALRSE